MEALSDILKAGVSAFAAGGGGGSVVYPNQVTTTILANAPLVSKTITVTDANAIAGRKVLVSLCYESDNNELNPINYTSTVPTGGSFKIYLYGIEGRISGLFRFHYTIF